MARGQRGPTRPPADRTFGDRRRMGSGNRGGQAGRGAGPGSVANLTRGGPASPGRRSTAAAVAPRSNKSSLPRRKVPSTSPTMRWRLGPDGAGRRSSFSAARTEGEVLPASSVPATKSGASCSRSPGQDQIWQGWTPKPSVTETNGSYRARRCGRRSLTGPTGDCASPGPIPMCPATKVDRCSSST